MDEHTLYGLLDELGEAADVERPDWKALWATINHIGGSFKVTNFASKNNRNVAWARFEEIVMRIKTAQARYFEVRRERNDFFSASEVHLREIRALADRADREGPLDDLIFTIATAGMNRVLEAGANMIFGITEQLDAERDQLLLRSERLNEAHNYLSNQKTRMVGRHKQEAFEYIQGIQDRLGQDWDVWKVAKGKAKEESQRAYEARQARREEFERRRIEWREKQEEYIERQNDRIERLSDILCRKRENLDNLHDKYSDARNPDYRERIEGRIAECINDISDLEAKIEDAAQRRDSALENLRGD